MTGRNPAQVPGPSRRLALFGDPAGLPQLLSVIGRADAIAAVGASIRPQQHAELGAIAERAGIPLLIQPKRGDAGYQEFVQRLTELAPDLVFVNSYSMILGPEILAIPRNGAVNVHGAMLPAYRGANPTEWALINGERRTGVTIHLMDKGIDTGPIIAQKPVPIRFEDTWIDVQRRVRAATETLLAEICPAILAGKAIAVPQDAAAGRHWPRRKADDGDFSWALPVIDIYNLIRALVSPHPGASAEGRPIASWQSVPSVVWRKFAAGAGAVWSLGRWRLVPHRPKATGDRGRANGALVLDICTAGRPVATCMISEIAEYEAPLRAALARAPRARLPRTCRSELEGLVAHFASVELRRDVAFG